MSARNNPLLVEILMDALRDDDPSVRKDAALALGELGTEAAEAVPRLRETQVDRYPDVQEAATDALRKIQGRAP